MGYKNPHSLGYQVEKCLACGDYCIDAHGDIGAFYNSVMNADLPRYTGRFYSASQNEMISDIKYSKIEVGYDEGLRDIRDAAQGMPLEAYIPMSVFLPVAAGASSEILVREPEIVPAKTIIDEILKAQAEVMGKKGKVVVEETEVSALFFKRVRKVKLYKKEGN